LSVPLVACRSGQRLRRRKRRRHTAYRGGGPLSTSRCNKPLPSPLTRLCVPPPAGYSHRCWQVRTHSSQLGTRTGVSETSDEPAMSPLSGLFRDELSRLSLSVSAPARACLKLVVLEGSDKDSGERSRSRSVSSPFDRRCPMVKAPGICGLNPLSMEFRDIEQSVYCWKSATEKCHRAGEPETDGVRGGISRTAPYQVPGSASGCWQVKGDSS
jgi:hypothetical protein